MVELECMKIVLVVYFGIFYLDLFWDYLDVKGCYENILIVIISVFEVEVLLWFIVIEIEDGYWMDDSFKEFLYELICWIGYYLIWVLIILCYLDDGIKFNLVDEDLFKELGFFLMEIDLKFF